jgi:NADH:ubiquinone oxidoreductase subunit F (NADH-binding)
MSAPLRLVRQPRHGAGNVESDFSPLLGGAVHYAVERTSAFTRVTADDLAAHVLRFGQRPRAIGRAGTDLVDTLEEIGLSGRGGSHFPAATKWRAHLAAGGGGVVVANGAESEPASAKDTALMQLRPHLILDGLACAAEAVGAVDAVLWLHGGAHAARSAMVRALGERRAARLPDPAIRFAVGPDHYLSGESSAIINALSSRPALPGFTTRPAAVSGVHGMPTLLHNVETLARTALAARTGAAGHQGTSLLTVADETGRTVVEVAPYTLLGEVIETVTANRLAGGEQAVLIGGFGGSWLTWDAAARLPADEIYLRTQGISLGAGVLMPVPGDACGIAVVARIADFLAASSARQCGPCLFGLRALADATAELARGRSSRGDSQRLTRFLAQIVGRGACNHPDGSVRMIESALATFSPDVESHRRRGRCLHRGSARTFPIPEPV